MLYGIGNLNMNNPYSYYGMGVSASAAGAMSGATGAMGTASAIGMPGTPGATGPDGLTMGKNSLNGDHLKVNGTECQTCKNRKYQDGSDEMVSFKSAAHMSPTEAGTRVRAHEQEHVTNAYDEAFKKGGKVLSASVALKTAICPECGRSYIAGGLTTTKISYPNEKNPYQKNLKASHHAAVAGMNFDRGV